PNRVLITEYRSRQVTERSFKGDVLWRKEFPTYVSGARRLANGHMLINLRNQVVELDRGGKEGATFASQSGFIVSAGRTRKGQTVIVEYSGLCVYFDENGREVNKFAAGTTGLGTIGSHADILPNGHVIIPQYTQNKVVEFDANGRKVWEATP